MTKSLRGCNRHLLDNGYTLYVNNREVQKGSDWTQPDAVSFKGILNKGDNSVVVVATNAGNTPNPAGLFFEARVRLRDGTEQSIVSDSSWQWTSALPKTKEGRLGQIKGEWKPVVVVSPVASWTSTVNERGKSLLVQAMSGDVRMIRASLLKSDFLMRSLGRPLREQIVSMRPDESTTLEAVDLSNGATLAGYLEKGGKNLAEQWAGCRSEMIDHLYQFALCRKPTAEERAAIFEAVSEDPKAVEIEDLLWAMFVQPQFLVR